MYAPTTLRRGASLLLALGALFNPAAGEAQNCVMALVDCYGPLPFEGIGYQMYYTSICQNPLTVASMYASTKKYCNDKQLKAGFKLLRKYCVLYGEGPLLSEDTVAENLTDSAIANFPVLNSPDDADPLVNLTTPVMVGEEFFQRGYQTEVCLVHYHFIMSYILTTIQQDWTYEEKKHKDFGYVLPQKPVQAHV